MSREITACSHLPLRTPPAPGDGPVYTGLAHAVRVLLRSVCEEEWDDAAALPASGGVIVVSNHVSYLDVLAVGRYLIWSGRWPRYLGKSELWKIPGIAWLARSCRQIPVLRGTAQAKDALAPARAALADGECVGIYPEGGRTRDPDLWPQTARTGAARLALETGVPVIPIANWGTHRVLPGRRLTVPRFWRRHRVRVVMGEPVDLADLYGSTDPDAAREATERIMAAVTSLVEGLRGERAPTGVWDPRVGARIPRGVA